MPAEWDLHERCWLGWPSRNVPSWRFSGDTVFSQSAFVSIAEAISQFEPVIIAATSTELENAKSKVSHLPNVRVEEIPNNDCWLRDSGAIFVVKPIQEGKQIQDRPLAGIHFGFNAWGGLYTDFEEDSLVPKHITRISNVPRISCESFILEGGSISVDGEGTLITTEECLLNPNRNPGLTKPQIEQYLKDYLGVRVVIWLTWGTFGDTDTSGHVDNMCVFARPGEVVLNWTDDQNDPQFERSALALKQLEAATDACGRKITVHKILSPVPMYRTVEECVGITDFRTPGERLPASYVNFYLANGGVVFPIFGNPRDADAIAKFEEIFGENSVSKKKIVPVMAKEVVLGGGCIHCVTQQEPVGAREQGL